MLDATIHALVLLPLIFLAKFAQQMILDGCDEIENILEKEIWISELAFGLMSEIVGGLLYMGSLKAASERGEK